MGVIDRELDVSREDTIRLHEITADTIGRAQ